MAPHTPNTIYFWKTNQSHGWLCNWYPSPITPPNSTITYTNVEQYLMHRKGLLFAPTSAVTQEILETTNPRRMKELGRQVPNYDDAKWAEGRYQVAMDGLYLKFTQNAELGEWLLETGDKELVEASPSDKVWGVGFTEKDAELRRDKWGANLMGKALTEVRARIRSEKAGSAELEGGA